MMVPEDAEVIYENPIIKVSTRKVGDIEKFATVHHPGAVAIFAHDEDRFYLTKQFRPAVGREVLELPAGTREADEEPEATAERELEEEIGKHPRNLYLMATFFSSPGFTDEQIILFRAWNLEDVDKPPADDSGTIEVVEYPMSVGGVLKALRHSNTAKTHIALLSVLNEMEGG